MSSRRLSLLLPERWTVSERWAYSLGVLLVLAFLRQVVFPADWPYVFLPYAVGVPVVYVLFGRWPGIAFLATSGVVALLTARADGESTPQMLAGYLLYLVQGGIACWMIDLLQGTTRSIRAEEQRKNGVLDAQTDWVVQLDAEGRFTYLNAAAAATFGLSPEKTSGKCWHPIALDEDRPAIAARLATLSPANPVVVSENRVRDAEGCVIWGQFVHRGCFDDRGRLTGILSVGRDITDRKQLEQQLAEVAKDLDDLYQHGPCAYCSVDEEGRFIKVNETLCDWLGMPESALVGHLSPGDFMTKEGLESFRVDFPRFTREGKTTNFEHELVSVDGSRRWVSVDSNALYDANGRFLHSRTVLTDITARRNAEAEVHRLNDELEHRVLERTAELARTTDELESFTYSLSHDLRAPIRAINATAAILLDEKNGSSPSELREGLAKIRGSSDRMAQLMDAMLALSALGSPCAPLLPYSHATLVRDALDTLLPEDSPRRAQIVVHELPNGVGNARRVQRVWENLLSNALKFTSKTPEPRIDIGHDADVFYVRDNGVGLDMRYADRILKPFERAHNGKVFDGAGIGLAIADKVVRQDGGRLWCESTPGEGATFHFTLHGPTAVEKDKA